MYGKLSEEEKVQRNISRKIKARIKHSLYFKKYQSVSILNWEKIVGYTIKEAVKHLESTMPKGYSWQDVLEGKVHIDHIIPIYAWNFTSMDHPDFKRCWALENLQLLPDKVHWKKSHVIPRPFQPSLKIKVLGGAYETNQLNREP
jgi:hypothetical protein